MGGEGACGGKLSYKNENSPFNFFQGPQLASLKNNRESLNAHEGHAPKPISLYTWGALGKKQMACPGSSDAPCSALAGNVYVQRAAVEEILLRLLLAGQNLYERCFPESGLWNISSRT